MYRVKHPKQVPQTGGTRTSKAGLPKDDSPSNPQKLSRFVGLASGVIAVVSNVKPDESSVIQEKLTDSYALCLSAAAGSEGESITNATIKAASYPNATSAPNRTRPVVEIKSAKDSTQSYNFSTSPSEQASFARRIFSAAVRVAEKKEFDDRKDYAVVSTLGGPQPSPYSTNGLDFLKGIITHYSMPFENESTWATRARKEICACANILKWLYEAAPADAEGSPDLVQGRWRPRPSQLSSEVSFQDAEFLQPGNSDAFFALVEGLYPGRRRKNRRDNFRPDTRILWQVALKELYCMINNYSRGRMTNSLRHSTIFFWAATILANFFRLKKKGSTQTIPEDVFENFTWEKNCLNDDVLEVKAPQQRAGLVNSEPAPVKSDPGPAATMKWAPEARPRLNSYPGRTGAGKSALELRKPLSQNFVIIPQKKPGQAGSPASQSSVNASQPKGGQGSVKAAATGKSTSGTTAAANGEGSSKLAGTASGEGSSKPAGTANGEGSSKPAAAANGEGSSKLAGTASGEGSSKLAGTASGEGSSKLAGTASGEGSSKLADTASGEGSSKPAGTASGEGSSKPAGTASGEGSSKPADTASGEGSSKPAGTASGEGSSKPAAAANGEGSSKSAATGNSTSGTTTAAVSSLESPASQRPVIYSQTQTPLPSSNPPMTGISLEGPASQNSMIGPQTLITLPSSATEDSPTGSPVVQNSVLSTPTHSEQGRPSPVAKNISQAQKSSTPQRGGLDLRAMLPFLLMGQKKQDKPVAQKPKAKKRPDLLQLWRRKQKQKKAKRLQRAKLPTKKSKVRFAQPTEEPERTQQRNSPLPPLMTVKQQAYGLLQTPKASRAPKSSRSSRKNKGSRWDVRIRCYGR